MVGGLTALARRLEQDAQACLDLALAEILVERSGSQRVLDHHLAVVEEVRGHETRSVRHVRSLACRTANCTDVRLGGPHPTAARGSIDP